VAGTAVAHKHTDLELALIRLSDAQAETEGELRRFAKDNREGQARTEANLDRLSDEMREFKTEMRAHAARSEKEWKEFRKMLGDEANRSGRLVEDVLAPSVSDLFKQLTGWQGELKPAPRQWRERNGDPAQMREFDLVAWAGDYFLLLEVKSTISPGDIDRLLEVVKQIREYFPEAAQRRVVAGLASFYMDDSIVTAIERRQLLAVGLSFGLAEFLNSPGFKPTEF